MKKTMLTLAAGCLATVPAITSLNAQGDAPQATCRMCPGVYIPASEVQAYVNKAIAEKRVDQQVRDVDIGKSNVAIGLVYRGKLDAPAPESVAEHDQVSEVYHIIVRAARNPPPIGRWRVTARLCVRVCGRGVANGAPNPPYERHLRCSAR